MSAALRMKAHDNAKLMIREGQYTLALQGLLTAMDSYGPHIGILCDVAVIHFLEGHMQACRDTLDRILHELRLTEGLLSQETAYRAHILLGKMLEEQGSVAAALSHYSKAAALDFNLKAKIQELRLLSWLEKPERLPELYNQILDSKEFDNDLHIELEHALMLAELQLFGVHAAFERLQKLIQRSDLFPHDKKFFLTDFAEAFLFKNRNDSNIQQFLIQGLQTIERDELTAFEEIIFDLTLSSNPRLLQKTLIEKERELSRLDLLRLLALAFNLSDSNDEKKELRQKSLFIMRNLDEHSRNALATKWQFNKASAAAHPLILSNETLQFGEEIYPIRASSFTFKAIFLFQLNKTYDLEIFIEKIYGLPADFQILERNRVAINRLNRYLEVLTGIKQIIHLDKTSIRFDEHVLVVLKK